MTDHCAGAGARLLDCSSNGTFVNGEPVSRDGTGTLMCNGDRLSLVLSVTPLVEHFFIYHGGMAGNFLSGQGVLTEDISCGRLCQ